MNRFFFSIWICYLFSGCGNDNSFVFLGQPESLEIREMCLANRYRTIDDISDNLQGEWELISYGCGFCIPHDHPTASVSFDRTSGVLRIKEDPDFGIPGEQTISFTWALEEKTGLFMGDPYTLVTDPQHHAVNGLNIFCEDYMYYDITPVDGPMFLYQKR